MTIRNESGKSQNIDNLKHLDTEDIKTQKPGFFKKYLCCLGFFPTKNGEKNIKPRVLKGK